jgi:hypothetical protein
VEQSPLLLRPFIGLLYQPWMVDGDGCVAVSGRNEWRGKSKYSEKKTCPSATLSTTDPTWCNPGWDLGRRGGRPATNRLSYGKAVVIIILKLDILSYPKVKSIKGTRFYQRQQNLHLPQVLGIWRLYYTIHFPKVVKILLPRSNGHRLNRIHAPKNSRDVTFWCLHKADASKTAEHNGQIRNFHSCRRVQTASVA